MPLRNQKIGEINEKSAFGELLVANPTPIVQLQFPYAVNPRLVTNITTGSGGATVTNSLLSVSSGTTTASNALFRSARDAKYHPGQGALIRWTSLFQASGTAGTEAISGFGNEEDGFFFGYDGGTFGILHRFGGALEHQTLTVSAGAGTASGTITITLDGTATEVEVAQNDSPEAVVRAIDAVTFAGWETQAIGNTVVFISHLAEAKAGAFTFVDTDTTGAAASFAETITGTAATNTWVAQTAWNTDTMDGSADINNPTGQNINHDTLNVFQVRFQWLGGGPILFFIADKESSQFQLVHVIKYANTNTTPSIQNPTLPLYISVKNKATTADIMIKVGSMAALNEGLMPKQEGLNNSARGAREGFNFQTETSVLALKVKPVFRGKANRVEWLPQLITFTGVGTGVKTHTLRIHVNPILGGDPSFTDVDTATSAVAFDVAGTTVSGGDVLATFEFGRTIEAFTLNITDFAVTRPPGTLFVFTIQINGGSSDSSVAVIWNELF